jgi:hypothetical protein
MTIIDRLSISRFAAVLTDFAVEYTITYQTCFFEYVLVIKNNSKETVSFYGGCTAYDSAGKKVDYSNDMCSAIAPSKSVCLQFKYDTGDASSFKYSIRHCISTCSNTVPLLRFEESQKDNNVVVTYKIIRIKVQVI